MVERSGNRVRQRGVQLKMRAALPGTSISVVSEPRAVATGSYAQLSINTYFVSSFLIRSLPLAVLTQFVATLRFIIPAVAAHITMNGSKRADALQSLSLFPLLLVH